MNTYIKAFAAVVGDSSIDVLVILFFLAAGFLWGMLGGKSKLLSYLFATYVALFLSPLVFNMFKAYKLAEKNQMRDLIIYLAILVVVFIILERMVLKAFSRTGYKWWQAFLLSFLAVGLFVSGTLNMFSLKGILIVSPITKSLFAGATAYLFWAAAPLVGLLLVSRGK
jgi:hypothetical protein